MLLLFIFIGALMCQEISVLNIRYYILYASHNAALNVPLYDVYNLLILLSCIAWCVI